MTKDWDAVKGGERKEPHVDHMFVLLLTDFAFLLQRLRISPGCGKRDSMK